MFQDISTLAKGNFLHLSCTFCCDKANYKCQERVLSFGCLFRCVCVCVLWV